MDSLDIRQGEQFDVNLGHNCPPNFSYYFEVLPVDALFIPFTDRHQHAFDIVARTIVVRQFD